MQLERSANLSQKCGDQENGLKTLNNDKILGNIEVKTTSPLSSSADHSVQKDEETPLKSASSSDGSSPSDLKERIRHFSSPKETTLIINRRLSQKQDLYFHGTAEKIEETEEREEQESASGVVEERGARARRRAKLRLQNQKMVVTNPTESNVLDSKSDSNGNQRSDRSSMMENRSLQPEQQSTLTETLNSPVSGRTPPSLSSYRSKVNGSSRSQRNSPLLRLCTGTPRENSPKNKIELQALSPVMLGNVRPTRFGGYRPQAAVILQNLSSGSELESSHEVTFMQQFASPLSSNRLPPISSRRSAPCENSEPTKYEVLSEINLLQSSDDCLPSTSLSPLKTLHDSFFYRMVDSSRNTGDTFRESAKVRSSCAKEEAGEFEKPQNENCIHSSGWNEIRTTPSTASSRFRKPPEDRPEQGSTKCNEAEDIETGSATSGFNVMFGEPKGTLSSDEAFSNTTPERNFTNVPTLALNSQEVSYITSPAAKASSERRLDTDALIAALSNVTLKQQAANEMPANVHSEISTSRFDGSDTSYGSSCSRRSKIPVKVKTNRRKSHSSDRQNVSASPEILENSFPVKNDAASNFENIQVNSDMTKKSSSTIGNYVATNFYDSISPASNWSFKETSRKQNKHFESESSDRTTLELKAVRSKDCLTPLQILSDEETQNETYTVNSNNSKNFCDPLAEPKTSNLSDSQREYPKDDDNSWKSDLEDQKSLAQSKGQQRRHTNIYKRQDCERTGLLENQMGDTGCQETSTDSSSDEEELKKIRHRDKLRFSLEKLAAEQLRKSICSEQTQTEVVTFFKEKQHSSSTSQLRHGHERTRDSPRIKKSQDRFPFTISEKTSVSSIKFKHPGKLTNLDPDRSYKLTTHPSITRLAGSGFEDTPADIINYVTRIEQANNEVKSCGVRGLVQKFSARLNRSKKYDQVKPEIQTTNVIYQNHAYREEYDSLAASCSESSLLKELRSHESSGKPRYASADSPDEKSSAVSDKKSPQHPYRRYDRDDLWVRTFEKSEVGKQKEDASKEVDECKLAKDPYSVFFVKSVREAKEFLPEHEEDRVKFPGNLSDEDISVRNRKSENKKNRNVGNGCLCLRFYRMIVPVSFRSVSKRWSRDSRMSVKKKSHFYLQRKKG